MFPLFSLALLLGSPCATMRGADPSPSPSPAPSAAPAHPQADALVARLVAAPADDALRQRLLAETKATPDPTLLKALFDHGYRLGVKENRLKEGFAVLRFGRELTENIPAETALLANFLHEEADALRLLGRLPEAGAAFERCRALREGLGDVAGAATALGNLGLVFDNQGDYPRALEHFERGLALGRSRAAPAEVARILANIGATRRKQGDLTGAATAQREALAIAEAAGSKPMIGRACTNLCAVLLLQGDYREAYAFGLRALRIREELGDTRGRSIALTNLGVIHERQGDLPEARARYEEANRLAEASGNVEGRIITGANVGQVLAEQGDLAGALARYEATLELCRTANNRMLGAVVRREIGILQRLRGDRETALRTLTEAESQAREVGARGELSACLLALAETHGDPARVREFARAAADLAREVEEPEVLWRALSAAGQAEAALGQPDAARARWEESVQTLETLRARTAGAEVERARFFEDKLAPYHALAELTLAQGKPGEAFAWAERTKARALLDSVTLGRSAVNAPELSAAERADELRLGGELNAATAAFQAEARKSSPAPDPGRVSAARARLDAARRAHDAHRTALAVAHPRLPARRGEGLQRPLSWEETAARLLPADGKTAWLEYLVLPRKTLLFVLTRGPKDGKPALAVHEIAVPAPELAARVERFRAALARRDLGTDPAAMELFAQLLGPARDALAGRRALVLVPDGPLWNLPFAALRPAAGANRLLADFALTYAPSASVLGQTQALVPAGQEKGKDGRLLVLANPTLPASEVGAGEKPGRLLAGPVASLPPWPEAETLAARLRTLYGPERTRVHVGAEATESRFKRDVADAEGGTTTTVQFAAHGVLDNRQALYSYLALAPGDGEDGRLEAREILGLNLHVPLVVLSACETARGQLDAGGEGIIGLAWALAVAGCPRTVVSQWKVDAASTAAWTLEFHRALRAGADPADAVRQAALALAKTEEFRHPFHWAPFVLVGAGGG